MAKNLSGDLQVASANRLGDGVVVYLDDFGQWTSRLDRAVLARDKRAAENLPERARAEAVSGIDLGTAASFGHNVLQETQAATVAADHSNGGAGLCVQLDMNSGAQSVAAAGNVYAGPVDCSKPTPGAGLVKSATCTMHVDQGIVVSTGTTASIVSSNCL